MPSFPIGAILKTDLRVHLDRVDSALAEDPPRRVVVYRHKQPIFACVTLADLEALRALSEVRQDQIVSALGKDATREQLKPFYVLLEWLARQTSTEEETSSDGDETEDESGA